MIAKSRRRVKRKYRSAPTGPPQNHYRVVGDCDRHDAQIPPARGGDVHLSGADRLEGVRPARIGNGRLEGRGVQFDADDAAGVRGVAGAVELDGVAARLVDVEPPRDGLVGPFPILQCAGAGRPRNGSRPTDLGEGNLQCERAVRPFLRGPRIGLAGIGLPHGGPAHQSPARSHDDARSPGESRKTDLTSSIAEFSFATASLTARPSGRFAARYRKNRKSHFKNSPPLWQNDCDACGPKGRPWPARRNR